MRLNKRTLRHVKIHHGGFNLGMPQQIFDCNDVQSVFNQMRGIGMTKGMNSDTFGNAGCCYGLPHEPGT